MDNLRPHDKTATLGLDQGYRGLHVRHVLIDGNPCVQSIWRPTPAELAALNEGAVIALNVLGTAQPPVRLDVTTIPEEG